MGKHFINARDTIVTEALDGLIATSGGRLARLDGYPEIKVVLRADRDPSKVAVVSGGGAGHEPSHAGFVGTGMLTAAVSGEIFASPERRRRPRRHPRRDRPRRVPADRQELHRRPAELRPRRRARPRRGAEGRDGDRRRRHRAARTCRSRAASPARSSSTRSPATSPSRARRSPRSPPPPAPPPRDIRSLGVALTSCAIPGRPLEARMGDDEAELGLGIHGEPGVERIDLAADRRRSSPPWPAASPPRCRRASADHALILNNLGVGAADRDGRGRPRGAALGPRPARRAWCSGPGPFMTALNMNGFSLSLIRLDAAREAALAAPVAPPAWTGMLAPVAGHRRCRMPAAAADGRAAGERERRRSPRRSAPPATG